VNNSWIEKSLGNHFDEYTKVDRDSSMDALMETTGYISILIIPDMISRIGIESTTSPDDF
jgi:hypothetical protein